MVSSYQVNVRKSGAAGKAVGVVLYVWDWTHVRDGPRVMRTGVPTGQPTAVLQHAMEAD
jgi:hypothetical protein